MSVPVAESPDRSTVGPAPAGDAEPDEWVRSVAGLLDEIQSWCRARGWSAKRSGKRITESALGTYVAPRLLFHTGRKQFLVEPVARRAVGVDGVADLAMLPEYDTIPLYRQFGGWLVPLRGSDGGTLPDGSSGTFLTESLFEQALAELAGDELADHDLPEDLAGPPSDPEER